MSMWHLSGIHKWSFWDPTSTTTSTTTTTTIITTWHQKNAELGTHNYCTQFCHEVFHWRHSQTSVCVCVSLTFWNAMISWFHGSIPHLSTFFSSQKSTMSISVSIRGFHPRSIRNPKSLVSQTRRYHQVHHLQHPVCLWAGLSLNRCWVKRTCVWFCSEKHDFS